MYIPNKEEIQRYLDMTPGEKVVKTRFGVYKRKVDVTIHFRDGGKKQLKPEPPEELGGRSIYRQIKEYLDEIDYVEIHMWYLDGTEVEPYEFEDDVIIPMNDDAIDAIIEKIVLEHAETMKKLEEMKEEEGPPIEDEIELPF